MPANRQIDRHADHDTSHPSGGEVITLD